MADDDLDEEFDPDAIDEELDDDAIVAVAIDADEIDPDEMVDEDDVLVAGDDLDDDDTAVVEEEVVAEAAPAEEPAARVKKKSAEDDEDEEEELDPDDVEADLDTILKDRIAAADDEEDDEELEEQPKTADAPDGVVPKRANEFMCPGCFLLVNRGQFGPDTNLQCPVGESECPAIGMLQSTGRPKPARSGRKR